MLPEAAFPESGCVDDLLEPDERIRVQEYRRSDDQWRFLLGRSLARHLLKMPRHGLTALAFTLDDYGRPRLLWPEYSRVDFNISHAGRWVGCATSSQGKVGIDLVRTADFVDWLEFADRYLAAEELRYLSCHDGPTAAILAARYWAVKEAVLKAVGTGFAFDPRSLVVDIGERISIRRMPKVLGLWRLLHP